MTDGNLSKEDICMHLGDDYARFMGAIAPPVFQTTLFTRKTGHTGYSYSRVGNPTVEIAEKKIAALEEGERGACFASGMAAISSTLLHLLERDTHVVAMRSVYSGTRALLEPYLGKFGIEVTYVAGTDPADFQAALRPNTRLIYLESPSSAVFSMVDLHAVAELAKPRGIHTVIDNTWSTPMFQNPLRLGIDLVLHSGSKYLGGHSDVTAGVVVGAREMVEKIAGSGRGLLGGSMDPHQAWLLIRGLRTLPVRMKQHQENGLEVARFLESHPRVKLVIHPGLESHPQYQVGRKQMCGYSGLFGFLPSWDPRHAPAFMDRLDCFQIGPSWGGYESLINYLDTGLTPEESERTRLPQRVFRLSVGLENPRTLIQALDRALDQF